jgi:hypothetical protein
VHPGRHGSVQHPAWVNRLIEVKRGLPEVGADKSIAAHLNAQLAGLGSGGK